MRSKAMASAAFQPSGPWPRYGEEVFRSMYKPTRRNIPVKGLTTDPDLWIRSWREPW